MTALEEVLSRLDLPEDTQDLLEQTDFDDAKSVSAVMPSALQNVPACNLTKHHQQHQHLHMLCLGANVATCQHGAT